MTAPTATHEEPVTHFEVPPVVKEVVVPCACAAAFAVFTGQIHQWWPLASHSLGQANAVRVTIEPRAGGRIFELQADGSEHLWGTVTVWDDPNRLAFTWHVGRPSDQAQMIEVTFAPAEAGTRVRLVHSGWQSLDPEALGRRNLYDKGWELVFVTRYAGHAAAAASGGTP